MKSDRAEGFTTVSSKCTPPPVADFTPDTDVFLCDTDCVDFMDESTNSPDGWSWTFTVQSGDIVLDVTSSNQQNPTICVTQGTSGVVDVELDVSNVTGNDIELKSITIAYASEITYYLDDDGDGYGDENNSMLSCGAPDGYVTDNTDCDDSNSLINPDAPEYCDGVDNNCDGNVDEDCECDGDYLTINTITEDINRAEFTVYSDALVNSGQTTLFSAGDYIELDNGFEVVSGTVFEAIIDDCEVITLDTDEEDEVFRIRDLDIQNFENNLLEEYNADEEIEVQILTKEAKLLHSEKTESSSVMEIIRSQKLKDSEIYILLLSNKDQKRIKKFLFKS